MVFLREGEKSWGLKTENECQRVQHKTARMCKHIVDTFAANTAVYCFDAPTARGKYLEIFWLS